MGNFLKVFGKMTDYKAQAAMFLRMARFIRALLITDSSQESAESTMPAAKLTSALSKTTSPMVSAR